MNAQIFEYYSTPKLQNRKKLASIALFAVWFGASFAIAAAFFKLSVDGALPTRTLVTAIIALIASIPVFLERKAIVSILEKRGN